MADAALKQPAGTVDLKALLDMSRMTLSSKMREPQTAAERWMGYLGFPLGIAVFLLLYYMSPAAGLSAAAVTVKWSTWPSRPSGDSTTAGRNDRTSCATRSATSAVSG